MKKNAATQFCSIKCAFTVLFSSIAICLSAQWLEIEGPPGGAMPEFAQGQAALFASGDGVPYRSLDGGLHWEKLTQLPTNARIIADSTQALASTPGSIWPIEIKVFLSNDHGNTWKEVKLDTAQSLSTSFQLFGGYVYANKTIGNGTFRTKDYGETWELVSDDAFTFFSDGGKMYRNAYPVILESSDGGFAWDTITAWPANTRMLYKKGGGIILGNSGALYCSKDNGNTWATLPALPSFPAYNVFVLHQNKVYATRKFSPHAIVADLSVGIFEPMTFPGNHHTLDFISTGDRLLHANWRNSTNHSTDGINWQKVKGMTSGGRMRVFDDNLYSMPGTGLYRLKPDKQHWEFVSSELEVVWDVAIDGDFITTTSTNGNIRVSSDGGLSFVSGTDEAGSVINGLYELAKVGPHLFAWDYGMGKIVRPSYSTDHGLTWKNLLPTGSALFPKRLAVTNGSLYLCDSTNTIHRWKASSQTFQQVTFQPIPFNGSKGVSLMSPFLVLGNLYAIGEPASTSVDPGLFVSTDAGQTWSSSSLDIGGIAIAGDTLFGAVHELLFAYSTDQGNTWQPFAEGLHDKVLWLETYQDEVFVSSTQGVFRRKTNGETPSLSTFNQTQTELISVAPNPFNDHFVLSGDGLPANIRLYNSTGKLVASPLPQTTTPAIQVSGLAHLPTGIYFLALEESGRRVVLKLVKQ
jgi:photosystem II stability/assembly factor-like uncharacterized protein